jgi:hypothetical protein
VSYLPTNPSLSDLIYRCSNLPRRQLGQQSESGRQVDVEVPRDNGRRRTNDVGARLPAVSEDARAVENAGRLLGHAVNGRSGGLLFALTELMEICRLNPK